MQWFILFGLRASWTSSIIVIHRRKWAARGGAGAGGSPRSTLSRSPTLSPPARESRDARCLRLTHSVAIRVCVPLCPLRDPRSKLVWTACSVAAASALLRILFRVRVQRAAGASGQQHAPAAAQLIGTSAYERTVSAIDHCMHALDFTLCLFRVARESAPDRSHVRISDITADSCQTSMISLRNNDLCQVSSRWCSGRVDKQCRFTAKMGNESRCFSRPWKCVLCYKLTRLSLVMRWNRFRNGNIE